MTEKEKEIICNKEFDSVLDFVNDPGVESILPHISQVFNSFRDRKLFEGNAAYYSEVLQLIYYSDRTILSIVYNNILDKLIFKFYFSVSAKLPHTYITTLGVRRANNKVFSLKEILGDSVLKLETESFDLAAVYENSKDTAVYPVLLQYVAYDYTAPVSILTRCGLSIDDNGIIASELIPAINGVHSDETNTKDVEVNLEGFDAICIRA